MLDPDLFCAVGQELANEARVPELACNTQVLATAHQGVGLTSFGGSRDALGVKIVLLAAGNGYKSVIDVLARPMDTQ